LDTYVLGAVVGYGCVSFYYPPLTACSRHTQQKRKKERKKTDNPREGWEDGTPPPHREFKERGVMR